MKDFDWELIAVLHETKNITKTAGLLYTTQPNITKHLHMIEEELGTQLMIRTPKGVEFTPAGNHVARKAKEILEMMKQIQREIIGFNEGESGTLYLGVPYSYARFILPSLLEEYTKKYPHVRVDIHTALSHELVRGVQEGEMDICFARYTMEDDTLCKELISEDQSYAVCNHPFELSDLPNIPYIEFEKNIATKEAGKKWWKQHFSVPQYPRLIVSNADTCLSMIAHNLGYGIFPDAAYFADDPRFYSIPLQFKDGTRLIRKTWMLYRKESFNNPLASNFIEFVRMYPMKHIYT